MCNFEEHSICPICHSENIEIKWNEIPSVNKENEKFKIAHCKNCNLYFVKEKVNMKYLENFYNNENKEDACYSDCNLIPLNYYYKKLKKYIEKIMPTKGNIFDVGCSGGYFLDIMDSWNRYGCEISDYYSSIAKKKFGNNIFQGALENYQNSEYKFDVITLQDCLDHTINPNEIIEKCYQMLNPKGLIVIKAHNIECLFSKIYGKNFYAIIPPAHLFYFNKKSIVRLLEQNNFKVVKYMYIPHLLHISTIFNRFAKGNQNSICYKIYQRIQNTWIGNVGIYKDLHDIFTVFAIKESQD